MTAKHCSVFLMKSTKRDIHYNTKHHTWIQVAMWPLFSSDLSATMSLSFVPGMNLNEENPW